MDETTRSTPSATLDPDLLAGQRVLCSYLGPQVPAPVLEALRSGRAAGAVLLGANVPSQPVTTSAAREIQAAAAVAPAGPLPAMIALDQEGGQVKRITGPPSGSAAQMGTLAPSAIEAEGRATGLALGQWGVNTNLAPVADVARPGTFEAAQRRSFGSQPASVASAVTAFVTGLHRGGSAATVKHFPGLGAATANTDTARATVNLTAAELRSIDLVPFAAGITAGADLVMVSSAVYPALDPNPALTSRRIVTDLLRGELGFKGVVISDAIDAVALWSLGTMAQIAVSAAKAGVDVFIGSAPSTCTVIQAALAAAIRNGELSLQEATTSYLRVLELRRRLDG
jgi:beta-N-acetylhexosaminidase